MDDKAGPPPSESIGKRLRGAVAATDSQDWSTLLEATCNVTAPGELVAAISEAHACLNAPQLSSKPDAAASASSGAGGGREELHDLFTKVLAVLATVRVAQAIPDAPGPDGAYKGGGAAKAASEGARSMKRGRDAGSDEHTTGAAKSDSAPPPAARRRVDDGGVGAAAGGGASGTGSASAPIVYGGSGSGGLEVRGVSPAAVEERLKMTQDAVNEVSELIRQAQHVTECHTRGLKAAESLKQSLQRLRDDTSAALRQVAEETERISGARQMLNSKIAELVSGTGADGDDTDKALQKHVAARTAATNRLGVVNANKARAEAKEALVAKLGVALDLVVKVIGWEKNRALHSIRTRRTASVRGVVGHLRRLLGIVLDFVKFELHKVATARGELSELHEKVQKHVALYGDGAPSRRRALLEQITEFEAVIEASKASQASLVERLSKFASQHIPQLPLDVCSPLAHYLKDVVARPGEHMDVVRPGVQALLDAAQQRVRDSVPKGPPPPERAAPPPPPDRAVPPPPPPPQRLADRAAPVAVAPKPTARDDAAMDAGAAKPSAPSAAGGSGAAPAGAVAPTLVIDTRDFVFEPRPIGTAPVDGPRAEGGCAIM